MRILGLALAVLAGLWAGAAHACNVPNPNLLAGDGVHGFVDGCPVPAVALNKMLSTSTNAIGPQFNAQVTYGAKGDSATDDSLAISSALAACSAAHGGTVILPPTGHSYVIRQGNLTSIPGGCIVRGYGHMNWPTSWFDNIESDWTSAGTWIRCDDTVNPCLTITGNGAGVEDVNFWQTQNTPSTGACAAPCTFTHAWTPKTYPFVLTVSPGANFFRIRGNNFINATNCIDIEGPSGGIAGIYSSLEDLSLGCANTGIKFHRVDNTLFIKNLHHEMWWFQGSSDWWGYLEGSGNHVDWDVQYLANPMIVGVEFAFSGLAMKFTDAPVTNGFGTLTFAAANMQGVDVSFNEVCQALVVASTTTHVTGSFANTIIATDTATSPVAGQCANQAGATNSRNFAIQLNSDNANVFFAGTLGAFVQGLALVGGGNAGPVHGQVHVNQLIASNYSAYQNGTPLLLTDTTGSYADAAGLDDAFSTNTPGAKCSGACASHVPYNDVAANLPTCSNSVVGAELYLTDLAAVPAFLATLTTSSGGGINRALAVCNGTSWTAH